jgi:Phage portal protein
MSRRSKRLNRAQPYRTGGTLLPQHIIQQALLQMKAQGKQGNTDLFAPGEPMPPQKGVNPNGWPRQWSFPIGYNTFSNDRTLQKQDIPSFEQLRKLAQLYDGIGICEKVWLDMIPKLRLKVQVRPALSEDGVNESKYARQIDAIQEFFEMPGGPGSTEDLHAWLKKGIVEQLQIDALYIYKSRDKAGRLIGLPIVAGDTMKPLLDDWGHFVGYQQFLWNGLPGDVFTLDQMVYFRESPAATSPYGVSRVERVMMRVNQALRKQNKDLAYYTEGNQPFAIMEIPEASNWTPDQIESFEQMWNALIAGNAQQQVRVRFTQPGMKYTKLEEYQLLTDFDQFLLNITTAAYGLSMADLGFTASIHKSSDDGQQNMLYRRTLDPIIGTYSSILTRIIREEFGARDLMVTFVGFDEKEDTKSQADAYAVMIQNAMISPSDAAHAMKLPGIPQTGPLFVTKDGITPLANFEEGSDFRTASDKAQLAGLKLAASPQPPQQPGQNENEPPGNVATKQAGHNDTEEGDDTQKADMKRWYTIAMKAMKAGRAIRPFASESIPPALRVHVSAALERCSTAGDVRGVFERVATGEADWQNKDSDIEKAMATLKTQGVEYIQWQAMPAACDECQSNHMQIRALGQAFPSGAVLPPGHGNCDCKGIAVKIGVPV